MSGIGEDTGISVAGRLQYSRLSWALCQSGHEKQRDHQRILGGTRGEIQSKLTDVQTPVGIVSERILKIFYVREHN